MGGGRVPWSISLFFVCFPFHFPLLSLLPSLATHVDASQVFDGTADPFRVASHANLAVFPLLPPTSACPPFGPARFHRFHDRSFPRSSCARFHVLSSCDTSDSTTPRQVHWARSTDVNRMAPPSHTPSNREETKWEHKWIGTDQCARREWNGRKGETRTCCRAQCHVDCGGERAKEMGNAGSGKCRRGYRRYTGAMHRQAPSMRESWKAALCSDTPAESEVVQKKQMIEARAWKSSY